MVVLVVAFVTVSVGTVAVVVFVATFVAVPVGAVWGGSIGSLVFQCYKFIFLRPCGFFIPDDQISG